MYTHKDRPSSANQRHGCTPCSQGYTGGFKSQGWSNGAVLVCISSPLKMPAAVLIVRARSKIPSTGPMLTSVYVGAGPTGLSLAISLLWNGVPVRIIDKAPEPRVGQKGFGIQASTPPVPYDSSLIIQAPPLNLIATPAPHARGTPPPRRRYSRRGPRTRILYQEHAHIRDAKRSQGGQGAGDDAQGAGHT